MKYFEINFTEIFNLEKCVSSINVTLFYFFYYTTNCNVLLCYMPQGMPISSGQYYSVHSYEAGYNERTMHLLVPFLHTQGQGHSLVAVVPS